MKAKNVSRILVSLWIVMMIVGFIAEKKYDSILFYVFALCYFNAFLISKAGDKE